MDKKIRILLVGFGLLVLAGLSSAAFAEEMDGTEVELTAQA